MRADAKKMQDALEADGGNLRQLTGEDHGPWRIVLCEHCGGEGRLYSGHPNDPHPRDEGPCPVCDGLGSEIVRVEPTTIDDLDDSKAVRE